jgi:hypothetical protein
MYLNEYVTYNDVQSLLSNAEKELKRSGVVSYKTGLIIFLVGFDANKNQEYSKRYNRVKSNFDANYMGADDTVKFPEVNSKDLDEKYLAVWINGKAPNGEYTGKYLFNNLSDIFSNLKECLTVSEYTDYILDEQDWLFKS